MVRPLNSLIFIKSDVKSRSAGAGSFDRLRINSFDKLRASSPAAYGFEVQDSKNPNWLYYQHSECASFGFGYETNIAGIPAPPNFHVMASDLRFLIVQQATICGVIVKIQIS